MAQRQSARLHSKPSQNGALPPVEPDAPVPPAAAATTGAKPRSGNTVSLAELPSWMRDNEWILTYYRPEMRDWGKVFYSAVGYLHNETVNIHTHFFGGLLAVACLVVIHFSKGTETLGLVNPLPSPSQPSVTWADAVVHTIFFLSAAFCLFGSATFHCVSCHSEKVSRAFNRLDYIGIVVLIVGSFYPAVFYGFFCRRSLQHLYLAAITVAGGAATYTVIAPRYQTPAYRRIRTYVFIALGLSAVFPIFHALLLYGWQHSNEVFELRFLVLEGVLYIGGALLYAERIPERFFPGRFDLFGASHQIFHVMIDLAAISHYVAIASAFTHRHDVLGGACD